jgi:hypothetical protein
MKTLTVSAVRAAAKVIVDQAKSAAASPAGDDSTSAGKKEGKE